MRAESVLLTLYQFKFEVILILMMSLVALLFQLNELTSAGSTYASATDATELKARSATYPEEDDTSNSQAQQDATRMWPMAGNVTVEFGVPHMPWQRRHTGIDIISHDRSSASPIVAFDAGTVSDIVSSNRGLGNHVVIDHGAGITSYYAHLSIITVEKGESVNPGDTVGREGSSGATTGRHLHFEIRVNGEPKNPRNFIDGSP